MTHRRRSLLTLGLVLAFLTYYVVSGIRLMRLPGLQSDELLFVNIARGIYNTQETRLLFGIPVMCFHYIGSLKSYLYIPILALFDVSVATVRLPAVLISAITLVVGFVLLRRFLPRSTALLALGLMATDPAFLFTTTLDFGPVVLMLLIKLACLPLLARFLRAPSTGRLLAVGVMLLIGIWDKLNFLWFAAALIVATGLVYRRRWWPWLRAHRGGWVASGALAGGFVAFAWLAKSLANAEIMPGWEVGVPLGRKMMKVFFSVEATLSNLGSFMNLTSQDPSWKAPIATWLVLGASAILLALFALSTDRTRHRRRRLLAGIAVFLGIVIALVYVQMVLTPSVIGPHHVMLLWPLHQWLVVFGLMLAVSYLGGRYPARALAGAVLLGLIGVQVFTVESQLAEIEQKRAFADRWSPLITELAGFVRARAGGVDDILFIDYGAIQQVRALSPRTMADRLHDIAFPLNHMGKAPQERDGLYQKYLAGKAVLIVSSAAGQRSHPFSVTNIMSLLDEHSCERRPMKSWFNERGKRVFTVMYARCPPLGG
jgi:hypothetical protein